MATQVMGVILDRASRHGRLRTEQIREVQEVERHMCAELPLILQKIALADRLALIDMDGCCLMCLTSSLRRRNRLVNWKRNC
ncbi:MAG: hypothetical protein ABI977_07930 [Acidobacteriota bacterium]